MNKLKTESPSGILNAKHFMQSVDFKLYHPSKRLRHVIEHFWLISWQIPEGERHTHEIIPHPACHLTFLKNDSTIKGTQKNIFQHTLTGSGNIIGTKFTPAGFQPFAQRVKKGMDEISGKSLRIEDFFKIEVSRFEKDILKLEVHSDKTQKIEDEIFKNLPDIDHHIIKLNQIIKQVEVDKSIRKVSDISRIFDIEDRQIQRLFSKYIGVSAKWIINRYRIHEALETIETTQNSNWSELALELGYYDQAHFIKDFKSLVGKTPSEYMRNFAKHN